MTLRVQDHYQLPRRLLCHHHRAERTATTIHNNESELWLVYHHSWLTMCLISSISRELRHHWQFKKIHLANNCLCKAQHAALHHFEGNLKSNRCCAASMAFEASRLEGSFSSFIMRDALAGQSDGYVVLRQRWNNNMYYLDRDHPQMTRENFEIKSTANSNNCPPSRPV